MLDNEFELYHPQHCKLRVFKTPNGKSSNWYAGFNSKGKNHRKSMGTPDRTHALKLAAKWYRDTSYELDNGSYMPPRAALGPTFNDMVEPTLRGLKVRRCSAAYIHGVRDCLADSYYVHRFFSSLHIKDISTRTWDDFRVWLWDERQKEGKEPHSERTVHQMKNAVRVVLTQSYIDKIVDLLPRFEDKGKPKKKGGLDRVCFNDKEYTLLLKLAMKNIKAKKNTRWAESALELRDYIVWMVNTGLRVGECKALRFSDVQIVTAPVAIKKEIKVREVCRVSVTSGKRGAHAPCTSFLRAPSVFRRIAERRGIEDPAKSDELIFLAHHREAFKALLRKGGLYHDQYGRKRDFVSLRHTYICFRLAAGVPSVAVAKNVRTSASMIDEHYTKGYESASLQLNVVN